MIDDNVVTAEHRARYWIEEGDVVTALHYALRALEVYHRQLEAGSPGAMNRVNRMRQLCAELRKRRQEANNEV